MDSRRGAQQSERFQMNVSDFSGKQWRILLILMLVNFVNCVDRQIVSSLFPSIRRDGGLSYVQLGYLSTAFTVVLSLASFPLGMPADRISLRAVMSAGVLFWSGATFASRLAGSFHATALSFYYLFVNLFSMAVAPVVIGRLADR